MAANSVRGFNTWLGFLLRERATKGLDLTLWTKAADDVFCADLITTVAVIGCIQSTPSRRVQHELTYGREAWFFMLQA